jgi:hypothetical protein
MLVGIVLCLGNHSPLKKGKHKQWSQEEKSKWLFDSEDEGNNLYYAHKVPVFVYSLSLHTIS